MHPLNHPITRTPSLDHYLDQMGRDDQDNFSLDSDAPLVPPPACTDEVCESCQ